MNEKDNRPIMITFTTGAIIRVLLFILLLEALYLLSDLVLIILTAFVIASAIEPAAKRLSRYHIARVPAVLIVFLFVLVGIVGLFYLVVPFILSESSALLAMLPNYVQSVQQTGQLTPGDAASLSHQISQALPLKEFIDSAKQAVAGISGGFWDIVGNVFGGIFSFILILVLSFYLAIEEHGVESFIRVITPGKHHNYAVGLWHRSQKKIGQWMQGQLLLGAIMGVLVFLLLSITGMKYAFLLAVFVAVLDIIPIFGPIIAAVPAVLLGFVQGGPGLGILVAGAYVLIQQFENHLIYPLVVKKIIGISPVLVIIALLVGGKIAGFLGVLIAVPVAAALMEFVADVQKEKSMV